MGKITVEIARPEDARELLGIYAWYVTNTAVTSEYEVPSVTEFENRIARTLREYPYLIARDGDRILGYAYARHFHDRPAFSWSAESSIYVNRDGRRGGVGRTLYTALEGILTCQNVTNLYAAVSYPEEENEFLNQDSYRFHDRLGYRVVGEFRKCRYKFDRWYGMVWMEKCIGSHQVPMPAFIPFSKLQTDDPEQYAFARILG